MALKTLLRDLVAVEGEGRNQITIIAYEYTYIHSLTYSRFWQLLRLTVLDKMFQAHWGVHSGYRR